MLPRCLSEFNFIVEIIGPALLMLGGSIEELHTLVVNPLPVSIL